jgi:protocatechuate 3,4-dioxygenase beta subunit
MATKRARRPTRRKPTATRLVPTAHQTVGPFFPAQFIRPSDNDLTGGLTDGRPRALGQPILVFGRVSDINDAPAVNVILEIWQANAAGRFNHPADRGTAPLDPNFSGWGRTWTERDGSYHFTTIKPGAYPAAPRSNRWFAPRLSMTIVGSGLMRPLVTCVYFPDEPLNDDDPQLEAIRDPRARRQLIALPDHHPGAPAGVAAFRFDIRLGGKQATPFLED